MNLVETQALINFYVQKGFNRHVQTLCKDVLKKRGSEPALLFWRAFAIGQEGMTHLGSLSIALALSFSLWLTHDSPSSISGACARFACRRHSRARRPAGQARRGPRRRVQPRAAAQGSQAQGYVLTRLLVWPLFVRSHTHKINIISLNLTDEEAVNRLKGEVQQHSKTVFLVTVFHPLSEDKNHVDSHYSLP
jgi:hypothetical protein